MTNPNDEDVCCNCGAGLDVEGGLRYSEHSDRWLCVRTLACIERAPLPEADIFSTRPEARRAGIDKDYEERGRG